MGSKNCLKEKALGPSTYLLVGFTLNLAYGAPTQAWLFPPRPKSHKQSLPSSLCPQSLLYHLSLSIFQPLLQWPSSPFISLSEWGCHHFYSHSLMCSHVSQNPKGSSRNQRIPLELVPDAGLCLVVDSFSILAFSY